MSLLGFASALGVSVFLLPVAATFALEADQDTPAAGGAAQTGDSDEQSEAPSTNTGQASQIPKPNPKETRPAPVMVSEPVVQAIPGSEPEETTAEIEAASTTEATPASEAEKAEQDTSGTSFVSEPVIQAVPASMPEEVHSPPAAETEPEVLPETDEEVAPEAEPEAPPETETESPPAQPAAGRVFVSRPLVQAVPGTKPTETESASAPANEPTSSVVADAQGLAPSGLADAAQLDLEELFGGKQGRAGQDFAEAVAQLTPLLITKETALPGELPQLDDGSEDVFPPVRPGQSGRQPEASPGDAAIQADRGTPGTGNLESPIASEISARLSVSSEGKLDIRVYSSNNSILVSVEDLERLSYALVEPKLHEALSKIRQTYGEFVDLDALREAGISVRYDAARNQISLDMH